MAFQQRRLSQHRFMADRKLSVVIAQAPGKNPNKRQLEEDIAAQLLIENVANVSLVPHLNDLAAGLFDLVDNAVRHALPVIILEMDKRHAIPDRRSGILDGLGKTEKAIFLGHGGLCRRAGSNREQQGTRVARACQGLPQTGKHRSVTFPTVVAVDFRHIR